MRGQLIKPFSDSQNADLVPAFDAVFLQTGGVEAEIEDVIDTSLRLFGAYSVELGGTQHDAYSFCHVFRRGSA